MTAEQTERYVELNNHSFANAREVHGYLAAELGFPEYYGRNLDALYDILTGLPHLGRSFVIILPAADAPCRNYAERICNVFAEAGVPFKVSE